MIYRKYNKGGMFLGYNFSGNQGASKEAPSTTKQKDSSSDDDDLLYKEFLKGDLLSNEVQAFAEEWKKLNSSSENPFLSSGNIDKSIDLASSLVQLKNNKKQYDSAYATAKTSGGLKELAVGGNGELFVLTPDNTVTSMSVQQYKKNAGKVQALTVSELLEQRNSNPSLVGQNSIFNVANNSIGMEKITEYARSIISKIGVVKKSSERIYSSDDVAERRKRVQEELQTGRMPTNQEIQGFAVLDSLISSSSEHNLVKEESSSQKGNVMQAVNYIWSTLDGRARNKLTAQAALTDQEPTQLLLDLVQFSTDHSESYSVKPVTTDQASGEKSGSSSSKSPAGKNMNNPQMMIHGTLGRGEKFEFNDPDGGTVFSGITIGTSALTDPQGASLRATTLDRVLGTGWNQVVDINNVFFGNKKVHPTQLREIATDGMSEMGTVYLPVDPRTGGPDNNSLQLFRQAMDKYEEMKDDPSFTTQDIEAMFNSVSFDVTINPDKSIDVKAQGGNVKPFWVTFAYTNDASDLVNENNDPNVGGLTKLSKNEHNAITPITDQAFTVYNREGGDPINIRPNKRLKSERTYKGIVAIPLRDGATANIDALVGAGPKKPDYYEGDVRQMAQHTSGVPFNQTSSQTLNR